MAVHAEPKDIPLPDDLSRILRECSALSRAFVVGGGVRDALLGHPVKDWDVEVYGHPFESLAEALRSFGRVDLVGRSFGVIKLTPSEGHTYDFSLPRRDSKTAPGHKGFITTFDSELSLEEATARRDFTLNALMYDPRRQEILDCHGGVADLRNGILRHTSGAFVEDPLRVLRGMQFVGRFNLRPHPETVALCETIRSSYRELASERVREEWFKWASRSTKPSAGLAFLEATGWIDHFPEIARLRETRQDPEWHPEGDVFIHTQHCCDAMVALPVWRDADEPSRIAWMLAILCHDFAKPATTREEMREGRLRIISPGHEEAGGPMAETFLSRINAPQEVVARVVPLVTHHLAHLQTQTDRAIRRLANRLAPETISGLSVVMSADCLGRPPRPAIIAPSITALLHRAEELKLQNSGPKPLLLGRHLLALGMVPGRPVGELTRAGFEAQLEGEFQDLDGALKWLARHPDAPAKAREIRSAAELPPTTAPS